MRLLIGAAVMATALAASTLFQVRQASAEQALTGIARPLAASATDVSARHRHYHHRHYRYAGYYPYDGYRPYTPRPRCYSNCYSDWNLPYFGRGW